MKKSVSCVSAAEPVAIERRMQIERRRFSYANCIPERRSGIDRRGLFSAALDKRPPLGQSATIKWGQCC
jgi:hypothetical protein